MPVLPPFPWLKVSGRNYVCKDIIANQTRAAGAEFAEFVLQAAYGSQKGKVVQSYVSLGADAGGKEIKKEIGADLDYFSVNVELGVSAI